MLTAPLPFTGRREPNLRSPERDDSTLCQRNAQPSPHTSGASGPPPYLLQGVEEPLNQASVKPVRDQGAATDQAEFNVRCGICAYTLGWTGRRNRMTGSCSCDAVWQLDRLVVIRRRSRDGILVPSEAAASASLRYWLDEGLLQIGQEPDEEGQRHEER